MLKNVNWRFIGSQLHWPPREQALFVSKRFKYRVTRPVTPREAEAMKKRQLESMTWTKPIFEYQEKKKMKAQMESVEEPHMIHVVTRIKTLHGRPWWEKEICEEFGLDDKMHKPVPLKNAPSVNAKLKEIKHLVRIQPLQFPHGIPEHESDFEHSVLKSDGNLLVKKKMDIEGVSETIDNQDDRKIKKHVTFATRKKHLDAMKQRYEIHKEYFKPTYRYEHNQDGKEYRYTKYPYKMEDE